MDQELVGNKAKNPMEDKIRVDLCHDHFARIAREDVCATCPSRLENEAAVKALGALNDRTDDDKLRAILSEIASLRRAQSLGFEKLDDIEKSIDKINTRIYGNGGSGINERLTIIETQIDVTSKNKGPMIAIATAALSAVIAIIGIILK